MPFTTPLHPLWPLALEEPTGDLWRHPVAIDELGCCSAVIEALPDRRHARALELGCGTGALTRRLASNCDTLLALEPSESALRLAEMRCEDQPWVQFAACEPAVGDWSDTGFSLIVIHDQLHRLDLAAQGLLAERVLASLGPGGTVLVVTKRRGAEAAAAADRFAGTCRPRLSLAARHQLERCRIDVLT